MLSKSILDKQQKIRELHIFNQEKNKNILNNYYRKFKKTPKIRYLSNDILEKKGFQTNLRSKNYSIYGNKEKINSINTNYNLFNPYVTMLLASGIKLSNYDSQKYVIKNDNDNDKDKKYYFGVEGKTPLYDDDDEIIRNTTWNNRDINKGKKRIFSSLMGKTYCDMNSSKEQELNNNIEDIGKKYNSNELFLNDKLKDKKKENELENKKLDEYYEKYHVQLNMSPDEFKKFKEFSVKTLTGDSNIKNEMKSFYQTNPDLFKCSVDEEIRANDAYLDEFQNKKKKKIDDEEKEIFYKKFGIDDELTEEEVLRIFGFLKEQTKSNNKISLFEKDNDKIKNKHKLWNSNNNSVLVKMLSKELNTTVFHDGENDFHDPYESLRKMKLNYQLANALTYIRKNLQFNQFNDFYTKVIEPKILSSKMKNIKITLKKKRKNLDDFKAKLFELFKTRARHKSTNMSFNEFKNIDLEYKDPQTNINKLINARIQEKIKNEKKELNLLDLINASPSPSPSQKLSRAQVLLNLRIELLTLSFPKHPPSRTMAALAIDSEEGVIFVYGGRGGVRFGDVYELRLSEGNNAGWNRIFMTRKDKLVTDESEPKERFGSTMHFYNDRLYIIGGEFEDWEINSPSSTVLIIFNIKTRKWDMVIDNKSMIKEQKLQKTKDIDKIDENIIKNIKKDEYDNSGDKKNNNREDDEENEENTTERRKFIKSDDSLFPCCSKKNILGKVNKKGNKFYKNKLWIESMIKGNSKITKNSKFKSSNCSARELSKGKILYKSGSIKLKPIKTNKQSEKQLDKKIAIKAENEKKANEILEVNSKINNDVNGDNNNNNNNNNGDNDGLPTEKQENLYWNIKPCLRRNHVSVLIGRSIFLYGGLDPSQHYLNDCWVFDLVSQFWSPVRVAGRAPPPLGHHSACLVLDSENSSNDELSLYNIPGGNRKNVKTLKTEGVFFFGGMNENRTPTNLFFYMRIGSKPVYFDIPKTEGKPPSPRISASMDFSPFINMIIIHGGRNDMKCEEFLHDFMLLDLETMNWIKPKFKDNIPVPRAEHQSAILGDKLLIFGGSNKRQVFNFDFTLVNLNFYQIAENKLRADEELFEDTFNNEK